MVIKLLGFPINHWHNNNEIDNRQICVRFNNILVGLLDDRGGLFETYLICDKDHVGYKPNRSTMKIVSMLGSQSTIKYLYLDGSWDELIAEVLGIAMRSMRLGAQWHQTLCRNTHGGFTVYKIAHGRLATGNSAQISVGLRKFHQWGEIRDGCMVNGCDMYHHVPKYGSIKKKFQYDCDGHPMVPPQTKASVNSLITTTKQYPIPNFCQHQVAVSSVLGMDFAPNRRSHSPVSP